MIATTFVSLERKGACFLGENISCHLSQLPWIIMYSIKNIIVNMAIYSEEDNWALGWEWLKE